MSGQRIIYHTSPFNAEATRPALAESDITPTPTFCSPQLRPDPQHCDGSMVSDGGRRIATVTVWPVSYGHPTFAWPDTQYSRTALLFTVALMPVAAAVGTGFNGLIRRGYATVTTLVLIGGAAVLGITQRAPVFAAVFTAELTPPPIWGMLLLAAAGAHWVRLLAGRRRRPAEPDRTQPHFKHCERRWLGMPWRLVDGSC